MDSVVSVLITLLLMTKRENAKFLSAKIMKFWIKMEHVLSVQSTKGLIQQEEFVYKMPVQMQNISITKVSVKIVLLALDQA